MYIYTLYGLLCVYNKNLANKQTKTIRAATTNQYCIRMQIFSISITWALCLKIHRERERERYWINSPSLFGFHSIANRILVNGYLLSRAIECFCLKLHILSRQIFGKSNRRTNTYHTHTIQAPPRESTQANIFNGKEIELLLRKHYLFNTKIRKWNCK